MTTEKAKTTAQHIIDDRHGADYYQDTKLLANYLGHSLNISSEEAKRKAEAIQKDRNGSNYYEDAEVLAGFIEPRTNRNGQI